MDIIFLLWVGFGVALAIQLIYILYYFFSIIHLPLYPDKYNFQPVSIIIATHNQYENLKKLIPALLQQNYHKFELVVVNDRSSDETYDYLKGKSEMYPNALKVLHIEDTPGKLDSKKYALTLGIKAASYENLLFTDADCMPVNKNWILNMTASLSEECQVCLGISEYEKKPGLLNAYIRFETFLVALFYTSFAHRKCAYMGVGRNMAYTKSYFYDNKGFHPFVDVIGGDDDLFVNKTSGKTKVGISLAPESKTISVPKSTWKSWYIQKIRHFSVSKHYTTSSKMRLVGYFMSLFLMITAIVAMALYRVPYFEVAMGLLLLRIILYTVAASAFKKVTEFKVSWISILLFEYLYLLHVTYFGIVASVVKKVRWN